MSWGVADRSARVKAGAHDPVLGEPSDEPVVSGGGAVDLEFGCRRPEHLCRAKFQYLSVDEVIA